MSKRFGRKQKRKMVADFNERKEYFFTTISKERSASYRYQRQWIKVLQDFKEYRAKVAVLFPDPVVDLYHFGARNERVHTVRFYMPAMAWNQESFEPTLQNVELYAEMMADTIRRNIVRVLTKTMVLNTPEETKQ